VGGEGRQAEGGFRNKATSSAGAVSAAGGAARERLVDAGGGRPWVVDLDDQAGVALVGQVDDDGLLGVARVPEGPPAILARLTVGPAG
jgi:hypothetical protein